MPLILNIDTALENAGIALSDGSELVGIKYNSQQTDHARWIHTAIRDLLAENSRDMSDLNAIAVVSGTGSYTGLRVGMATAKGLCYALNIPLIMETTFKLIVRAVKKNTNLAYSSPLLYAPMIDARRMEVFTALYGEDLAEIAAPSALVLDENSYAEYLLEHTIVFAGNGSPKWQAICKHSNAVFSGAIYTVGDLTSIALEKYNSSAFADLAYSEPFYLKNVYTGSK